MERVRNTTLPAHIGVREVLDLAWPVIVSMLSYTLMSAADAVFVGQLGTAPLAAIGISITMVFFCRSFPLGLLGGVRVVTAQHTGAEEHDEAVRTGWQGLWLAGSFGLAAACFAPLGGMAFGWMGAGDEVAALASTYFVIRIASSPLSFGLIALTAWFQGRGDTRTPMVANVVGNGLNIALDIVLIFGWGPIPAMGIAGAAWATVIAVGVALAILLVRFAMLARGTARRPSRALLGEVWDVGSPLGVMEVVDIGAYTVFTAILTAAGEAHLAAHVVVVRIILMSFLPGHAIGSATGVLVGQAVGARRPEAAGQAVRAGLILALGVMTAWGVAFVAIPDVLIGIFGVEADVLAIARMLLLVAAAFQVFDAVATVLYSALTGAGDTRFVMWTAVLLSWSIKVPVAWALALPLGYGAPGAWVGFLLEIMAFAALTVWRVRSGRWLVLADEPEPAPAPVPAR